MKSPQVNALTVDVEDYFQVAALAETISPADWNKMECRVERNTHCLLDIFDDKGIKATFFVLGWIAERYSQLVRDIAAQGHEIASHGYSHQLIYQQSPGVFREETTRAKYLLEDITGQEVNGYRAASYSITEQSRWALDVLCELGFRYDSSIFPIYHDRYGMPGTPAYPYRLTTEKGNSIIEFPLTTLSLTKYKLPIAGGGYFRLFPYWFTRLSLKAINYRKRAFIFYLHPWEIDPEQPRFDVCWMSRFRHYHNLQKCENRLKKLLDDFYFSTVDDVLVNEYELSFNA